MPADVKTIPGAIKADSLQNAVFTCQNDHDRREAIDKAFDYRGDVTLTVRGETVEGYMFNRDAIAFTGKDTADGKSWEAWVSKKASERQAEAARIEAEAKAQGHL
jgi:hypothetical protein